MEKSMTHKEISDEKRMAIGKDIILLLINSDITPQEGVLITVDVLLSGLAAVASFEVYDALIEIIQKEKEKQKDFKK